MKIAVILSLALLGLAATMFSNPATAKPGNGHGQPPTSGAVEEEVIAGRGRGQRPTAATTVGEAVEVSGQGNRPISNAESSQGRGRGNRPRPDSSIQEEETPEFFPTESSA
jgi:hypothetical protein